VRKIRVAMTNIYLISALEVGIEHVVKVFIRAKEKPEGVQYESK